MAMSSWETKSWSTLGVSKPLNGKHDDPTELGYFGIPHFEDPTDGFQRPWGGKFPWLRPIPFDFLVEGEFLRSSVGTYLEVRK